MAYFDDLLPGEQAAPQAKSGGYFDDLMPAGAGPKKIGKDALPDYIREELRNANWGTRNIAGFGTALSNVWEGAKQFVGKGDADQIAANKIIEQEAPVGAIAGNVAMTAIPFAAAGNTLKAAAAVGGATGLLQPVEGEQTAANIAEGKLKSGAVGAVTGLAGQYGANKFGEVVTKKLADLALKKSINAPIDQTLDDALNAGLKVTPTSANPTWMNQLKESFAGKAATSQAVSNENAPLIDALARRAIGLADDAPLTSQATQAVRKQAYQAGYDPIARLGTMKTDGQFIKDLDSLVANHQGASASFPGAFKDEVSKAIAAFKVSDFDAGNALKATQLLRDEAQAAFRAGDTGLYQVKKGAAKAIEEQIARNLSAAGQNGQQLLKGFQDARMLMAKAHTVEDAIVEGGGSINASKLAQRLQAGKPLSGELEVIGKFANNFKNSVQPASKVQGPGVSALRAAMASPTAVAGYAVGGPVGGVLGAAGPLLAPPLIRSQMLSKSAQNQLRRMYELGIPTRVANRLLENSAVGGTVLGLEALRQ